MKTMLKTGTRIRSELMSVGKSGSGQVVEVPDGTYEESLYSFPSGTPDNPFVLKAENNCGATICPSHGERILAIYASNVIVDGFILDGVNVQGNNVWIEGGTNVTIQNCELRNIQPGDGTGEGSYQGIFCYNTSHNTIKNNRIYDVAPGGSRYNHGIYWIGADSIIENNTFFNIGGNAIQVYGSGNPPIANNIIRDNVIYDYALRGVGNGIYTEGAGDQIYNNLLYQTKPNGNAVGMSLAGSNQVAYHNTIYQNGYIGIGISGSKVTVKNNIIYKNGTNIEGSGTLSNNLTTDPRFVSEEHFNFLLTEGSPAIDAGAKVGISTDITGGPRDSAPDIGAYEFVRGIEPEPEYPPIEVTVVMPDGTVYRGEIQAVLRRIAPR